MKKFLLILLALTVMAGTSVFAEGAAEDPSSAARPEVEITKAYYFGEPTDNPEIKEEWMAYMSDRFEIDLKVNAFPRPEYMTKYALAMSSGEIHGLGWIFGGTYMEDYFNDGASIALDDYVKTNAVWNSLPEGMRTENIRSDVLVALPSGWSRNLGFARSIRTDWLENLGLDMPETIEDLWEVNEAFLTQDPDGNGKDDTVPMTSAGVWNMQDIFMTFGVPTNHVADHCITPDPNDGMRFNDGFLKPGMKAALEWLNASYEAGHLDKEVFSNGGTQMRDRMRGAYYGSTYYWASWGFKGSFENGAKKIEPNAKLDIILGLTSDFAKKGVNLGPGQGTGAPYILIAGTENPQEQVDAFINIFLGDEVGHWSGRYGVYEKMWDFGPNNEIVRQIKTVVDDARKYYPGPGIVGDIIPGLNHIEYPHVLDGEDPAASAKRAALYEKEVEYINEGLAKGLLYPQPNLWNQPTSDTYRDVAADFKRIFEESVAKAVTGQVSVDEAIADYKKQIGALGGQKVLDEANAFIGKTSSTVYRY
jgi:ABC-type glycerol-3-phosphate transport system substrate-binding protein